MAFVIEGRVLLTAAKNLLLNPVVHMKKRSSDEVYIVLFAAKRCELSLITVDDEESWDDYMSSLSVGKPPILQDDVTTIWYPMYGVNFCLTSSVTSHIVMQGGFFTIDIDAAINHGNSGSTAFDNSGKVVGVRFQNSELSGSQGFLIALDVVLHIMQKYEQDTPSTEALSTAAGSSNRHYPARTFSST